MGARPLADDANGPLALCYRTMVAAGEISADAAQVALVRRFDRLCSEFAAGSSTSLLSRLLRVRRAPIKGLYVYGNVGRGKTMLMDAFFAVAPVAAKRRIHFNEFMGEVHDRIHVARESGAGDPIVPIAAAIAGENRLLCLDEFSIIDIADAMILARLFGALFGHGLVLVATSNSAPNELYKDGLNRPLFLPFVALLKEHAEAVRLDAATDYRLARLAGAPVYVTPLGTSARGALDEIWRRLTGKAHGEPTKLRTRGRDIRVPEADDGVARFSFADLCEAPFAAHDYLQIARAFHTVIVDDIPVLRDEQRDAARRFILLIDTLYDHHVNLIASAATEPLGLFMAADGDEAFAFRRTISRLMEMRSEAYLGAAHGAATLAPRQA